MKFDNTHLKHERSNDFTFDNVRFRSHFNMCLRSINLQLNGYSRNSHWLFVLFFRLSHHSLLGRLATLAAIPIVLRRNAPYCRGIVNAIIKASMFCEAQINFGMYVY